MVEPSRYNVSDNAAGISGDILENKLEIKDKEELEDAETLLLSDTYEYFLNKLVDGGLEFDINLLFDIHRYFLDPLYRWAGEIRKVDISKDGVFFAPSAQIKNALERFEEELKKMNLNDGDKESLSEKLAVIHCELNAIHPFREGNGRTIRLFLDLIAVNNGFGLINYGTKEKYIEACIAGMQKEYGGMKAIIYTSLN